jgi:hypothetical protein
LLAAGCQPQFVELHGKVTLDGKPLDEAAIMFVPLAGSNPVQQKTGCPIRNGEYLLNATEGVTAGKYRVDILDVPPLSGHTESGPPQKRRPFPHHYSHESPLKIEIPAKPPTGSLEFNFDLKS